MDNHEVAEGIEHRKLSSENHDLSILNQLELKHVNEKLDSLKQILTDAIQNLNQERKSCWKICNEKVEDIERLTLENSGNITGIKWVGSTIAIILGLIIGIFKFIGK